MLFLVWPPHYTDKKIEDPGKQQAAQGHPRSEVQLGLEPKPAPAFTYITSTRGKQMAHDARVPKAA